MKRSRSQKKGKIYVHQPEKRRETVRALLEIRVGATVHGVQEKIL